MENTSIVIFSSGISEKKGITEQIKHTLTEMGYACADWRELFSFSHSSDNIALLPLLIKKIPTFDFAVLICEGHDTTYISRGKHSEIVKTMRDNVLFEIGLCAMAVGLNRTVLITDPGVRLPDDLRGRSGQLAVKQIAFSLSARHKKHAAPDIVSICEQIHGHIQQEKKHLNQVIIGAAASGACGYASNFICRTLEHIDEELVIHDGHRERTIRIPPEKVYLHIELPNNLDQQMLRDIRARQEGLCRGCVPSARNRAAQFHFYFQGDEMHIVDYPTNIVTSYDTVRMILQMDANDTYDARASERFVAKELSLYKATLETILNEAFVRQVIAEHYSSTPEEEREKMLHNVLDVITNRFTVTRYA